MSAQSKEQKLIAAIKNMLGSKGRFIGDDCAVLPNNILVTSDTLVEEVHFKLLWTSLFDLGWKAMSVNLSDIAAMAGRPQYALVVLSAPQELYEQDKIISLYKGISECANEYNTVIIGGDITRGNNLAITITVIGQADQAGVLLRSGAKNGDIIVVTGDFGASHAGLSILKNTSSNHGKKYQYCLSEFCKPKPKLAQAQQLIKRIGNRGALMDTSDGLADALLQISQASNVGMQIDLAYIPIAKPTIEYARQMGADPLDYALYGGEDYQLLACLSAEQWSLWQKEVADIPFQKIGKVVDKSGVWLISANDKTYEIDSSQIFQHIS